MSEFYNIVLIAQLAMAAILVISTVVVLYNIRKIDKKNKTEDFFD